MAAREAAEKKKEEDKQALENCVGKTADEALEIAQGTEFEYRFVDDFKVDVTDNVNAVSNGAEVHTAKVREVEVGDGGWFSGPNVTFHLDFTDPVAEKERQRKEKEAEAEAAKREAEEAERVKQAEAEAARREQEEAEKAALEAQKKKDQDLLEGCAGKTAEEAYETAEASVLAFRFLDSYDVDVTQSVKDAVAAKRKAEEQVAKEQAAKKKAAEEQAAKKQAAKEQTAKNETAKGQAIGEQATKEQAAQGQATGEQATKEQAAKGQATGEQATKEQAAKNGAAEESNSSKQVESGGAQSNSQTGTNEDKKVTKDSSDEGDKSVKDSKDASKTLSTESKVLVAKVSKVEVTDGSWFSFDGATIRLDYTDPVAEKERKAERPTVVFSDVQYDAQLMPPDADSPYSLELTITGKLKVEAAEKGSRDYVDKSDLPTLVVKAGEITSKLDIICDQVHSRLEAGGEFAFSYKFSAPNAEQKPAYKFSFAKSDRINRKGLDKKLAGEIEKFFNERMANLDAEIAEREEAERQRAEQERIEAEQRAEQERIEAEQRAAEEQAEREQRAAEAEERRRQMGCVITETGNCYHSHSGCPSLSRSHNLQEITVGEAEDMGLSPCDRCH